MNVEKTTEKRISASLSRQVLFVGANLFARCTLTVRINSHLHFQMQEEK
jgi:hypothetical protein